MPTWLLLPLVAALTATGSPQAAPTPSMDAVLERAGAGVVRSFDELPRLVARETMTQRVRLPPGRGTDPPGRQWVAEFAWLTVAGEPEAIGVRDVIEVDGAPVPGATSRLVDLLHGPAGGTWMAARAILDEGARHNLVPGSRNFNLPTVALFFLHPERRPRFSWKRRGPGRAAVWEVEFRERERPTVIRGGGGEQVYSRGRVWIEAASGVVRRTELRVKLERVEYTLETTFEFVPEVQLTVPTALDERYSAPDGVVVSRATYTGYRRFQTGARMIR